MAIRLLSIVVLLVLFASTALAQQIYKWKDEKGQWHFTNFPPPETKVEKVKGVKSTPKSSPATSPRAEPSVSPSAGSESKGEAVSKLPTERVSDVSRRDLPRRWLLLLPNGKPWEFFDSDKACARHIGRLIAETTYSGVRRKRRITPAQSLSSVIRHQCISLDEFKPSKEANVMLVITQLGRDQRGGGAFVSGRVFNRGQATARNVVVKYQVRSANGTTFTQGQTPTSPEDIPRLTFAEFRSQITGIGNLRGLSAHTEVDWAKE